MGQEKQRARLPLKWGLMILFAFVPVAVAAVLQQLLGPPGQPLSSAELARLHVAASPESFLPGAITYSALVTIHVVACIAAIVFAQLVLRSVPRGATLGRVGFALGLGVSGLLLLLAEGLGRSILAYRLTYFNFEDLFRGTGPGDWLLDSRFGMTTLGLAAYLPTALGVFAVALTASAAVGQLSRIAAHAGDRQEEQEGVLCLAAVAIKRLTYALSLVLVTSTVTASLFFQLPAKLVVSAASRADLARLEAYGFELTLFWGATYSLMLLAAVGFPLLLVQQEVRKFLEGLHPPEHAEPFRDRMAKAGALSGGGEQMKVLFAFVAPLVSAPVTSFLQAGVG